MRSTIFHEKIAENLLEMKAEMTRKSLATFSAPPSVIIEESKSLLSLAQKKINKSRGNDCLFYVDSWNKSQNFQNSKNGCYHI